MRKKVFIALDNLSEDEILKIVDELKDEVMFKINDAFTSHGPSLIKRIHEKSGDVFLDLKFHDIPNTVTNYAKAACALKVFMFNVHASGGFEMMKAARNAVDEYCKDNEVRKPLLIGVTVLTSMSDETLRNELKTSENLSNMVKHYAALCKKAGLDGVVCSPHEIKLVKEACGKDFLTVTPGVRPLWSEKNDQKRITTPRDAAVLGADFLVIGRPVTHAEKYGLTKKEAVNRILEELK